MHSFNMGHAMCVIQHGPCNTGQVLRTLPVVKLVAEKLVSMIFIFIKDSALHLCNS